ncbi:hypothetical protein DSM104443_01209 [Usitatibacter rugosus]|uniref:RCC1-like domain-containing protein n=1 Tax=Usitatibacter rugosus TaxID=2732067 RepID=A0A6M4GSY1_9PROT|nr:RCC1 domain-containing protein [Usitatibacter rugosus]QJR10155.1 hypothetical protein DSM104443_01209 [Usitatibacter rugosus]
MTNRSFLRHAGAVLLLAATSLAAQAQLTPVKTLDLGVFHGCSLADSGAVSCWGANNAGQIGDGTTGIDRTFPVAVTTAARIGVGSVHACLLTPTGAPRCWGFNSSGQLGDGTFTDRATPTDATGFPGTYRLIKGGGGHTCAVTTAGGVRCSGFNGAGQLGDGTIDSKNTSVPVTDLTSGVVDLQVAYEHNCVLTSAGGVRCWGNNTYGQLGDGTTTNRPTPITPSGLGSGVASVTTRGYHTCALKTGGAVLCWGRNDFGQLGDGTLVNRPTPVNVTGPVVGSLSVAAGSYHTCVRTPESGVLCWGFNLQGQLGDGTRTNTSRPIAVAQLSSGVTDIAGGVYATCVIVTDGGVRCWGDNANGLLGVGNLAARPTQAAVRGAGGSGLLDLTQGDGVSLPAVLATAVNILATGNVSGAQSRVNATIGIRPEDQGTAQNVYVYALVPASRVTSLLTKGGDADEPPPALAKSAADGKDTAVACVLAQLTAGGQLQQVSASGLQALVTGIVNSATASVTVLNGVTTATIAGATIFTGYGTSAAAMFGNATGSSVATIPGQVECRPQAPQKGWWWNPAEGGRGFSMETRGDRLFFAAFLYDTDGRASWYVAAGRTTLDGSSFSAPLIKVTGGQTLGGAYPTRGRQTSEAGVLTLAFNSATQGTIVWPGGLVPIQRFAFAPEGLTAPPQAGVPESGWWWNPAEDGRGFFIEFQNGSVDIAGYMYDEAGNPIWYLTMQPTANPKSWSGSWWQFANGQTLTGAFRQNTRLADVAPLSLTFDSATTATLTLPNGRSTRLIRYEF